MMWMFSFKLREFVGVFCIECALDHDSSLIVDGWTQTQRKHLEFLTIAAKKQKSDIPA